MNKQLNLLHDFDLSKKQKIAESEHKKFVDFMYPYFGLEKHPGYCRVKIKKMFLSGAFCKGNKIFINDYSEDKKEQIPYITWHETSHFIHYFVNPFPKIEKYDGNIVLQEIIAEIGPLIFLDLTEGLNSKILEKYKFRPEMTSSLDYAHVIASLGIAKNNKGLLKELVKADRKEGMRLARPYWNKLKFKQ